MIDFEKLPGGDPKLVLDPFIQETLTDRLANDNGGLDMAKVETTFGKSFAETSEKFSRLMVGRSTSPMNF